jgi:N-methylhydantoinase B
MSGGGGYGDPLDRPPELVAADVRVGIVSIPGAWRDYGVVVVAESSGQVDLEATRRLRAGRRTSGQAGDAAVTAQ